MVCARQGPVSSSWNAKRSSRVASAAPWSPKASRYFRMGNRKRPQVVQVRPHVRSRIHANGPSPLAGADRWHVCVTPLQSRRPSGRLLVHRYACTPSFASRPSGLPLSNLCRTTVARLVTFRQTRHATAASHAHQKPVIAHRFHVPRRYSPAYLEARSSLRHYMPRDSNTSVLCRSSLPNSLHRPAEERPARALAPDAVALCGVSAIISATT